MSKSSQKKLDKKQSKNDHPPRKDHSPRIPQRDKLDFDLHIYERDDWTENQRRIIDLIMDKETKLVLIDGPAGTAKTYLAVYTALKLLNKRGQSDILYVRSIIESASKSLGSLPGSAEEKLNPFLAPLYEKLDELLPGGEVKRLKDENRAAGTPINYLRGASFNARVIIGDECQNYTRQELITLMTRLGKFSKMVLTADKNQADIGGRSGWPELFDLFDDEESRQQGIHCIKLTREDIVRSGIVGYIVGKVEDQKVPPTLPLGPMFPPQ